MSLAVVAMVVGKAVAAPRVSERERWGLMEDSQQRTLMLMKVGSRSGMVRRHCSKRSPLLW